MSVDTRDEAVERVRATLRDWYAATANEHADAVDLHAANHMLAALLAERDAARQSARAFEVEAEKAWSAAKERREEAARLREALREIAWAKDDGRPGPDLRSSIHIARTALGGTGHD